MRATKAIIHLDRLRGNIQAVREKIGPNPRICVPIKADAYGHGAVRIAVAAIQAGAGYLAVASTQEGIELRDAGIVAPILLLSQPLAEELPDIVRYRLTLMISDADFAAEAAAAADRAGDILSVHLKVDTGMGRMGCRPGDALVLARHIGSQISLKLTGTATHFAVADSAKPDDVLYTKEQIHCFQSVLEEFRDSGVNPGIVHAANSGAVVLHGDSFFDMVRPGLLLYGYPPVREAAELVPVEPVMELRTHIVFTKEVFKGESVSYGRTWQADRNTILGTLPVGYADGLPRSLSGRYSVAIGGKAYPLVGTICMDQCLVDLGPDTDLKRWDEVTVFGNGGSDAADVADILGTIPYEITCNIHKRVPRVYVT
ncbi:alanine racemase [Breznakiella homolactica]|uniref:Alanine racemase n=1 Tax=Breznakiella homolactica TaxID=2798577 RepID=A0A7T8BAQ0_9SPIR|nr:alanine racemase [Breznakiella homolactica]QQO09245.1 alanine racemase [Breznakiella homolactica]